MSKYIVKGSPNRALWGATMAYTFGFAAVTLFSPLANYLGLGLAEKGLLLSIVSFTGSLLRIPFAGWTNVNGGKKPMTILLAVAFLGLLGISFLLMRPIESVVNNKLILLLFGAMAGFGIATFTVSIPQMSYWFPQKEQGKIAGICGGVGGLAPGIFLLIITNFLIKEGGGGIGIVATYFLWTAVIGVALVLYVIVGVNAPYFQLVAQGASPEEAKKIAQEEYKQEIFPQGSVLKSLWMSAKSFNTWGLMLIYFATFGGFLALTNWFKEFFYYYHGLSISIAALLTSVYSMGAATSRTIGGFLSDRFGGKRLANIFLLLSIVGSLLLATNEIFAINILGYIFLIVAMGVVSACVFKIIPQLVPNAVSGTTGWVGGLGAFGGFVIPNLLAIMLTENLPEGVRDEGYLHGFYVFAGLMVVSIIVLNLLREHKTEA